MFWNKSHTIVSFKGNTLNYSQVTDLLSQLWQSLENKGLDISEVKSIYSVVTELLENAYRYSDQITDVNECFDFTFSELSTKKYIIKIKNPVEKSKAIKLNEKINFINSLSKIGLKKLYQYEIVRNKNDNHTGGGLGLIIIARKIEEPLQLELIQLNTNITIVNLTAKIKL